MKAVSQLLRLQRAQYSIGEKIKERRQREKKQDLSATEKLYGLVLRVIVIRHGKANRKNVNINWCHIWGVPTRTSTTVSGKRVTIPSHNQSVSQSVSQLGSQSVN